MTALLAAAVGGPGLVDPVAAGLPSRRRGAASRRRGVRDRADPAAAAPVLLAPPRRTARALVPRAPAAAARRRRGARRRRRSRRPATDEGVLRLFRTGMTLLATVGAAAGRARGAAAARDRRRHRPLARAPASSPASRRRATRPRSPRSPRPSGSGADDAIYLGEGETVLEATMSNVWWRDGDVLVTPALSTGVLPGVTRGAVAALARAGRLPDPRGLVHAAGAARAPTRRSRARRCARSCR